MSAAPVRPPDPEQRPPCSERLALERVLRSDVLNRAPNLILFLRYVCEMQIAGRQDAIKEYNIAVEALGRSSDFDQKRDSIVRVEAHRLRKRLSEYYEGPGAADPIEILLPPGSYVPVFRRRTGEEAPAAEADAGDVLALPGPVAQAAGADSRRYLRPLILSVVAILLLVLTGWGVYRRQSESREPEKSTPAAVPAIAAPQPLVRIAAGSDRDGVAGAAGTVWQRDRFFFGGDIVAATPRSIRRTTDDRLYLTRREGDFEYRIPVAPGSYELRLHFAETVFGEENVAGGGESSRVFNVQVNGGEIWTADIISEAAGSNTATIRVYRNVRPTADGTIRVAFRPGRKEAAFVNAIEVLTAPGGLSRPVRLVARPSSVVLASGEEWAADQYWLGGAPVQRHEPVLGPEPSLLYQAERYGNFSYAIPVAPGTRYTLTLRFAETWFGQGRPGGGGEGSRTFDVYCNGRTLLRHFDVLHETGGPMRQIKKVFRNLEPNAQGKLDLQFVPIRNYAMVNAIEVVDEGP